ncbi:hypothetical protein [Mycobacterium sherrisii]|uniref:hypothetical protein n=1 Tax=Mycobacterium sherrisii TaxID=243061 RepID=UPI0011540352|nr:hypothetical protein [Mycobacterium sherrisii]MCV7028393.1 hypothetical protein [Mycobacterium sherrisii]MEC4764135.1 hypothetical protein [Mycobacterium sherrisii]
MSRRVTTWSLMSANGGRKFQDRGVAAGRQCGLDRRTAEFEGSQLLHRDANIVGQHQGGPN